MNFVLQSTLKLFLKKVKLSNKINEQKEHEFSLQK